MAAPWLVCNSVFMKFVYYLSYLTALMHKLARIHTRNMTKNKPENPGFPASKNPGFRVWEKAGNPGFRVPGYPGLPTLMVMNPKDLHNTKYNTLWWTRRRWTTKQQKLSSLKCSGSIENIDEYMFNKSSINPSRSSFFYTFAWIGGEGVELPPRCISCSRLTLAGDEQQNNKNLVA